MVAIKTKYLGPTNFRGSRVKAKTDCQQITINWDCALNSEENHQRAAQALCDKMGWTGKLATGSFGNGYFHCFEGTKLYRNGAK